LVNVKYLDKGLFEYLGPFGLYNINKYILNKFSFFFFHKIYFSLFLKFFIVLNVLFIFYFFYFNFFGLFFVLFFKFFIESDVKLHNI
jgi:hypothetical protein